MYDTERRMRARLSTVVVQPLAGKDKHPLAVGAKRDLSPCWQSGAAIQTSASSDLSPAIGHHVMLISMAATIVGGVASLRGAACAGLLRMAESLACCGFRRNGRTRSPS
ncbi:hypothetical protein WKW80_34490 [Variovorax humicola]|uniref:Uncharacterized protein n=1 Tax=Variovorax humicola TaxID=1769758 RepID=A0ABU8WCF4_9BURK